MNIEIIFALPKLLKKRLLPRFGVRGSRDLHTRRDHSTDVCSFAGSLLVARNIIRWNISHFHHGKRSHTVSGSTEMW